MNHEITPEKLSALRNLLREKMTAAKAAGWEIRRRLLPLARRRRGDLECCAFGALLHDCPVVTSMNSGAQEECILSMMQSALCISRAEAIEALTAGMAGFDDGKNHPSRGGVHDVCHDLAVEFVDAVT